MRVESEGRLSTKRGARRSYDLEDVSVGNESGFAMESDGIDDG